MGAWTPERPFYAFVWRDQDDGSATKHSVGSFETAKEARDALLSSLTKPWGWTNREVERRGAVSDGFVYVYELSVRVNNGYQLEAIRDAGQDPQEEYGEDEKWADIARHMDVTPEEAKAFFDQLEREIGERGKG